MRARGVTPAGTGRSGGRVLVAAAGVDTDPRRTRHVGPDVAGEPATRVIDLAASERESRGGADRRSRRRRGWSPATWVLVLVLVAVAVGALALAAVNYVSGARWRDAAVTAQRQVSATSADVDAVRRAAADARRAQADAERRAGVMRSQLDVSEADVVALEARIDALANDRAHAGDRGETPSAADVATWARTVDAQLDSCIAQVAALHTMLADADPGSRRAQRSAAAARASCEQADADTAALLDGAGSP